LEKKLGKKEKKKQQQQQQKYKQTIKNLEQKRKRKVQPTASDPSVKKKRRREEGKKKKETAYSLPSLRERSETPGALDRRALGITGGEPVAQLPTFGFGPHYRLPAF